MKNEMGFLQKLSWEEEGTFVLQQHTIVCSFWKDLYYGQPRNLACIFTALLGLLAIMSTWADISNLTVFKNYRKSLILLKVDKSSFKMIKIVNVEKLKLPQAVLPDR